MTEDGIPQTAAEAVLMSRLATVLSEPVQCEGRSHEGQMCGLEASYYVGVKCPVCDWESLVVPVCQEWVEGLVSMYCECGAGGDAEQFMGVKEKIK